VLLLIGTSCGRLHSDPEELYRQARASFERGELAQAADQAETGFRKAEKAGAPERAFRFRVLLAEIFAWQGKPKDSLALLEATPPQDLANSEAALRRLIVLGTADYLTQRFDDAQQMLMQAEQIASTQYPTYLRY